MELTRRIEVSRHSDDDPRPSPRGSRSPLTWLSSRRQPCPSSPPSSPCLFLLSDQSLAFALYNDEIKLEELMGGLPSQDDSPSTTGRAPSSSDSTPPGISPSTSTSNIGIASPLASLAMVVQKGLLEADLQYTQGFLFETAPVLLSLLQMGPHARQLVYASRVFQRTVAKMRQLRSYVRTLTCEKGWMDIPAERGLKVTYRTETDAAFGPTTVKVCGEVDAAFSHVIQICCEAGMIKDWMPMTSFSERLPTSQATAAGVTPVFGVYQLQMSMPFLAKREWVLDYYDALDRETGCAWAFMDSVDGDGHPDVPSEAFPRHDPHVVKGTMPISCCLIKPVGPNRVYIEALTNVDLKFKLPHWLQVLLSKIAGVKGFQGMVKATKLINRSAHHSDSWVQSYHRNLRYIQPYQECADRALARAGGVRRAGVSSEDLPKFPLLDHLDNTAHEPLVPLC
ncbi:unnamed protein product [Vitrella brassicaformis CCMP3155]|uniref:START domain-containing protein n=2 Tax=Vitrella brassicaformis TaxID=1169539 RepID=A0A0G4EBG2_VITBC|nr:unnamed protein product [Vitrella brassicaformis CCMP3155]|mmetsp:Transcript_7770/g.19083  ORF Transcript_7770/g.19083 Transcript_7770/m.19083 type:complete len:452 (+) Transcript_7770:127-1482(+)|eukprot:CEL93303.1 unnamed protein product [Vitrella brassicaformis CCMP3155]